ncbi:ubiquitinyl hydrolase 1 ASCRUDRAFT_6156 [Ascoidea rubescens DSM 1968]|uniref:MINDY deubiquitinase domain-containing protein n=1 Tax=Ascoidea rubescens DSM 1968 TaxID=1344418 RepID=A0A1D2VRX4_9ASCO|nr:hypothetical protein ASCRUDRAFT_6156 [Ascoidea rubescens DSM 1968]ODV64315.1 hypothetical protein ASCRUDRAFT_6156 [Ascoidea rubescens DSM 1968]
MISSAQLQPNSQPTLSAHYPSIHESSNANSNANISSKSKTNLNTNSSSIADPNVFKTKKIKWLNPVFNTYLLSRILIQNSNGPCALLSIINTMILSYQLSYNLNFDANSDVNGGIFNITIEENRNKQIEALIRSVYLKETLDLNELIDHLANIMLYNTNQLEKKKEKKIIEDGLNFTFESDYNYNYDHPDSINEIDKGKGKEKEIENRNADIIDLSMNNNNAFNYDIDFDFDFDNNDANLVLNLLPNLHQGLNINPNFLNNGFDKTNISNMFDINKDDFDLDYFFNGSHYFKKADDISANDITIDKSNRNNDNINPELSLFKVYNLLLLHGWTIDTNNNRATKNETFTDDANIFNDGNEINNSKNLNELDNESIILNNLLKYFKNYENLQNFLLYIQIYFQNFNLFNINDDHKLIDKIKIDLFYDSSKNEKSNDKNIINEKTNNSNLDENLIFNCGETIIKIDEGDGSSKESFLNPFHNLNEINSIKSVENSIREKSNKENKNETFDQNSSSNESLGSNPFNNYNKKREKLIENSEKVTITKSSNDLNKEIKKDLDKETDKDLKKNIDKDLDQDIDIDSDKDSNKELHKELHKDSTKDSSKDLDENLDKKLNENIEAKNIVEKNVNSNININDNNDEYEKLSIKDKKLIYFNYLLRRWLNYTSTQLTKFGLEKLNSRMKSNSFSIFFRNDHFNTMIKFKDLEKNEKESLFILVTDEGFLKQNQIVWSELKSVDGSNDNFYNGEFKEIKFIPRKIIEKKTINNSKNSSNTSPITTTITTDTVAANSSNYKPNTIKETGFSKDLYKTGDIYNTNSFTIGSGIEESEDYLLAKQIQLEEDERVAKELQNFYNKKKRNEKSYNVKKPVKQKDSAGERKGAFKSKKLFSSAFNTNINNSGGDAKPNTGFENNSNIGNNEGNDNITGKKDRSSKDCIMM